jgi:trimethylamine--corrinoid protein Co-methyltransferase
LDQQLIERIVAEAREILAKLGVEIHNPGVLSLLADHGARVEADTSRAFLTDDVVDKALKTVASGFALYDVHGQQTHDLSGDKVHFTAGSAAISFLDHGAEDVRPPTTADYVKYVKVISQLGNIASQSTSMVPSDVHEQISDSYRLFLGLTYGHKPVVTGAFTIDSFNIMRELQLAVRGSPEALVNKPLTLFSCCPTAPLKWSDVTSQNVVDCAKSAIPVEYISMPLSGFVSPVTLVGTLVQHTADTLSGVVISQLTNPGTPALYGGSPAVFDMRYETTPMGAVETMMIDCAYNEIGKFLGMPTQAYMGMSDSKQLDAQTGLESSMGATLAALAGMNNVSGPGMMDFESCFSLEKLVVDNEICGMTERLVAGIEPKDDFPALERFQELLRDQHLLISDHTRTHLKSEHYMPGPVIDRANRARWREEGRHTLGERAHAEVKRLTDSYQPNGLPAEMKSEMLRMMLAEAKRYGMDSLPHEAL